MKKWLGRIMISAPFVAIFVGMVLIEGWLFALGMFAALAALSIWIIIAFDLMDS